MPREFRKRGKKNKKKAKNDEKLLEESRVVEAESEAHHEISEPSWIRSAAHQGLEVNPEAPFGYVDQDIKAYFRTVDVQMRGWQEAEQDDIEWDQDTDPNEDRRLFFVAALEEMGSKERQLATDPDCSVILERAMYSMDDFVRRVFMDSLTGSFEILSRHRFASHVCQTLFSLANDTITRENRGVFPTIPSSSNKGELRTITQLVLDFAEELLSNFTSLIMDPFASHVVRALLVLLSPNPPPNTNRGEALLRSKKSAAWKAKQGPMKSVFIDEKGEAKEAQTRSRPTEFHHLSRRFVEILRSDLSANEVRALAADKVASPSLQLLLEVEAVQGLASDPDSLMDRVMVGMITACRGDPEPIIEPSDYLNTLLRDPTSSHLLETIVTLSPVDVYDILWKTYFAGKLARLAMHPVANFVLAKALERVSADHLSDACQELEGSWSKTIRSARTGVLRAAIDRSAALQASEFAICEAVYSAFELVTPEERARLVPCVLCLLPLPDYISALAAKPESLNISTKPFPRKGVQSDSMEPKIQGSILLQSLLQFASPYNHIVISSLMCLSIEERIKIAHNASGSRVYDALLDSPSVPLKAKRELVLGFIGHYHLLVDDRLGSRVGDKCWCFADTYLKEKVARSLLKEEQFLAASYYGKFFSRNLNLYLLQRRPDDWKSMQASRKYSHETSLSSHVPLPSTEVTVISTPTEPKKRKRPIQTEDEIDVLFNASLGNKIKKAALGGVASTTALSAADGKNAKQVSRGVDELHAVLGAIRSAPKDDKSHRKRKRN